MSDTYKAGQKMWRSSDEEKATFEREVRGMGPKGAAYLEHMNAHLDALISAAEQHGIALLAYIGIPSESSCAVLSNRILHDAGDRPILSGPTATRFHAAACIMDPDETMSVAVAPAPAPASIADASAILASAHPSIKEARTAARVSSLVEVLRSCDPATLDPEELQDLNEFLTTKGKGCTCALCSAARYLAERAARARN